MPPTHNFFLLLGDITARLNRVVTLESVARRAGRSRFQVHREFERVCGETLKQFTLRLQLERAAAVGGAGFGGSCRRAEAWLLQS